MGSAASVAALVLLRVKEIQKAKCILFGCCCCHYMHLFTCIAEGVGTERDGHRLNYSGRDETTNARRDAKK